MPDTSVKYFHSGMTGAPVLSGTVGAMLAVLDACLVNGFGLKTVDSLTVTDNVATINIASGHSFEVDTVVEIAGATPSSLNGQWKVSAITSTSASFATTGISNQTATGTITAKLAPAGWVKQFSGTNKAAYKSGSLLSTGMLLRVDDTAAQVARVIGYEAMSDVDTGTGLFPTASQNSGGSYWAKSSAATSAARSWLLIADDRMFYFAREYTTSVGAHELTGFGDFISFKSGDAYACVLCGIAVNPSGASPTHQDNFWRSDASTLTDLYATRSYSSIGASAKLRKTLVVLTGTNSLTSGNGATPYPNPADGGLYVTQVYLSETDSVIRGVAPGYYGCPQAVADGQFLAKDKVVGVTGLTGRKLMALTCSGNAPRGVCFFDITGPWR